MRKIFVPYNTVRNDAIKLASVIFKDGFAPNVIYCLLRGGAYMANVISEYLATVKKNEGEKAIFAACVAHSYEGVGHKTCVKIDGWTKEPKLLKPGERVLIIDDIFDSGGTINAIVPLLLEHLSSRDDIKIAVHDYKVHIGKKLPLFTPDYYCKKWEIDSTQDEIWVHYMSHEIADLTKEELEMYYYNEDNSIREAMQLCQRK